MIPCKRCLLKESMEGEKYEELIGRALSGLRPVDKVTEELYEERLDICKACAKLNEGTCLMCGCFVEIRAYLKNGGCPAHKWKH